MSRNYFLSLIGAAFLAGASGCTASHNASNKTPAKHSPDYEPSFSNAPESRQNYLIAEREKFIPDSFYESDHAYWSSALEQLAGSSQPPANGVVKLFAELSKYPSTKRDSWREWENEDVVFGYNRDGERHKFSIRAKNKSFEARYSVGVNEHNDIWVATGEVLKRNGGIKWWSYILRPEQLKAPEGSPILVQACTFSGDYIGNSPVWKSREPTYEGDVYTASKKALTTLKEKRLNDLFKDLR